MSRTKQRKPHETITKYTSLAMQFNNRFIGSIFSYLTVISRNSMTYTPVVDTTLTTCITRHHPRQPTKQTAKAAVKVSAKTISTQCPIDQAQEQTFGAEAIAIAASAAKSRARIRVRVRASARILMRKAAMALPAAPVATAAAIVVFGGVKPRHHHSVLQDTSASITSTNCNPNTTSRSSSSSRTNKHTSISTTCHTNPHHTSLLDACSAPSE